MRDDDVRMMKMRDNVEQKERVVVEGKWEVARRR